MKVYIEELSLQNYRNFRELKLVFDNNIVIITGDNGSGKTNILESISFLSPGKGIRGVVYHDICMNGSDQWSSSVNMHSKIGKARVKFNFSKQKKSRDVEYNGSPISNLELTGLANIIWLTPQMDGIFLSQAADKRRFLDRIVYNFHTEHASNLNKYTKLTSDRLKSLLGSMDEIWLKVLEEKIAVFAEKVVSMRSQAISYLETEISKLDTPFPKANLSINNLLEIPDGGSFVESYSSILHKNRQRDAITKRTNFGITKQELIVMHSEKKQLAKFCSTGEQKALLISILLGQIEANKSVARTSPILLLDELFVHLDDQRKESLANYIVNSNLQTFITATDLAGLGGLSKLAQVIPIPS